ncbi:hypothetical protein EDB85DRAFT_2148534 [Lactarius pseudohatsudake]|nr:hypothetical protein EDB85DRAFT_2148534 [Lactarius pseudohatsudake]
MVKPEDLDDPTSDDAFCALPPISSAPTLLYHLQLDGVGFFPGLPSGLHLVEQDVVRRGACIFRRRQTSEHGQCGFRLSSLAILLAGCLHPRPWHHVPALKTLVRGLHFDPAVQGARLADLGCAGAWHGWSEELELDIDDGGVEDDGDGYEHSIYASPTLRLPHLLRVPGPSSLTLYKHVLCCSRGHVFRGPDDPHDPGRGPNATPQLKGKHKEDIDVLGIIMPHDIDMLERESRTGRGWIACTTDTVFLEKPQYCDMTINLTSYAPGPAARDQGAVRSQADIPPLHRITVRFTWSDVNCGPSSTVSEREMDERPLSLIASHARIDHRPRSAWTDAWGVYEVVCVTSNGTVLVRSRQACTTLALLQTFHPQKRFLLSRLATVLPPTASTVSDAQLTRRDFLALALGPLSSRDARFVEWLAEVYPGGARVSVRG